MFPSIRHSVGDTVYFYDGAAGMVGRGSIVRITADSSDATCYGVGTWHVLCVVEPIGLAGPAQLLVLTEDAVFKRPDDAFPSIQRRPVALVGAAA